MEMLHELHQSGRFDLIVVDTPPTQHALAFLDAPRLITRLIENRLYRPLVAAVERLGAAGRGLAPGSVHRYLAYMLTALIAVLVAGVLR